MVREAMMSGKSLNRNKSALPATATLSPGDFPLGSMLSRAAARSMLATLDPPQDDLDAVVLFAGVTLLNARMDPSYPELERSAAYSRGKDLSRQSATVGTDFSFEGSTLATRLFHMAFGRTPERGDLLRYEDVKVARSPVWHVLHVKEFIAAWNRQILGLPCPLRVDEDNRIFRHLGRTAAKENNDQEWQEDLEHRHSADVVWSLIKSEVQDYRDSEITGMTFTGSSWRLATKRELQEVEIEPTGGLLGLLATAASQIEEGA
jgi:hypothetical protein